MRLQHFVWLSTPIVEVADDRHSFLVLDAGEDLPAGQQGWCSRCATPLSSLSGSVFHNAKYLENSLHEVPPLV